MEATVKKNLIVQQTYRPKIDWWVYLVLAIMVGGASVGAFMENNPLIGLILGGGLALLWLVAVSCVKYEIRDNQLGIRKFFRWTWIPIEKIATIEKQHGVAVQGAVSAVLSLDRLRMTLTDRSVLRSSMPIAISPKHADALMARLKEINPTITTSHE